MKNGILEINNDFVITNKFTVNDLKSIERKYSIEPVVINGIYESYKTKPIILYGQNIIATLYFENNVITRVSIYFVEASSGGWSTDTESAEKQKKALQDQWLLKLLQQPAPYNFKWGKIESVYDQRSCSSAIVISFL